MRELLKNLRTYDNEKLLEKLNYNQIWYEQYYNLIHKYGVKDGSTKYFYEIHYSNIQKIKKVLKERNITIEFINGWKIIK